MKIAGIIQARMGSKRLPGKSLVEISGKPLISLVIERALEVESFDSVVVATTNKKEDQQLGVVSRKTGAKVYRGSEKDVLQRYVFASRLVDADLIVRLTGDCPLFDPKIIDLMVQFHINKKLDYSGNLAERSFPRGLDAEVISSAVLEKTRTLTKAIYHREHVTPFIYENPGLFKIGSFLAPDYLRYPQFRLCVDTEEDLVLMRKIYRQFYHESKIIDITDVIKWLKVNPKIASSNVASENDHQSRNMKDSVKQRFV